VRCIGDRSEPIIDHNRDARLTAETVLRRVLQGLKMVLGEPVAGKLVGSSDPQVIAFDGDQTALPNPRIDHGRRHLAREGLEEAGPEVVQHGRPHLHTQLSTDVDS
jgi:hypothetical protein